MNRLLIYLILCLGTASSIHAQLIRSYGVKVAYTSAEVVWNDAEWRDYFDRRKGFNAAMYVEWFNESFVSVLTQVEYAQRGNSHLLFLVDPIAHREYLWQKTSHRLDYLSIPVLGKIRFPIGFFSPFIAAGPRVDFLLGNKTPPDDWNMIYDDFRKINLGASVSLGSEINAPLSLTFSIEARYNFDLASAYPFTSYRKAYNNSFDVWLGVGF